jgi:hypothetical protein
LESEGFDGAMAGQNHGSLMCTGRATRGLGMVRLRGCARDEQVAVRSGRDAFVMMVEPAEILALDHAAPINLST